MHWSLPSRGGMRGVGTDPWEFAACPPGTRGARMLAPYGKQGTSPAWHLFATGSPKCSPSTRPSPLTLARLFWGAGLGARGMPSPRPRGGWTGWAKLLGDDPSCTWDSQ